MSLQLQILECGKCLEIRLGISRYVNIPRYRKLKSTCIQNIEPSQMLLASPPERGSVCSLHPCLTGASSQPLAVLFKHLSKVVPRPCLDLQLPHSQWGRCLEAAKVSQFFLLSAFGMTLAEILLESWITELCPHQFSGNPLFISSQDISLFVFKQLLSEHIPIILF